MTVFTAGDMEVIGHRDAPGKWTLYRKYNDSVTKQIRIDDIKALEYLVSRAILHDKECK